MKKVAWILASGALIAACGGGGNRADVGVDTGGGIVLMDTGPGRDAFVPMGRDSGGPPPGTCGSIAGVMSVWPPLPSSCLPRCSGATLTAIQACPAMDDACFDGALMADTTPAVQVDTGGAETLGVDCGGNGDNFPCTTWQNLSCIGDSCPAELGGYVECANMAADPMMIMTVCASQITALNNCQTAQMAALSTCARSRVVACFDTGGGFLPPAAAEASFPNFDVRSLGIEQLRALRDFLSL